MKLQYSMISIAAEHLRINSGEQVWPGADNVSDIDMATEIWWFFNRCDINARGSQ